MDLGNGGLFADQKGFTATANKLPATASQLVYGDFDGNANINASDITIAREVLIGAYKEGSSYFYEYYDLFADINDDKEVDVRDLIHLKKLSVAA